MSLMRNFVQLRLSRNKNIGVLSCNIYLMANDSQQGSYKIQGLTTRNVTFYQFIQQWHAGFNIN